MKELFKFCVLAVLLGVPSLLVAAPIHDAVYAGDFAEVKRLIDNGADVNARGDRIEWTPLRMAVQFNNSKMIKLLIKKGADLEIQDSDSLTALHVAVQIGLTEVAKLLIEKGADIDARAENGWTPLRIAVQRNKAEMTKMLIQKGATVDAEDNYKNTPLHMVSGKEAAELLIRAGADVTKKNFRGETPLDVARKEKKKGVLKTISEAALRRERGESGPSLEGEAEQPEEEVDPITADPLDDPITLSTGTTLNYATIKKWILQSGPHRLKDPMTHAPLTAEDLEKIGARFGLMAEQMGYRVKDDGTVESHTTDKSLVRIGD
jgi:ankyrin repeat protein